MGDIPVNILFFCILTLIHSIISGLKILWAPPLTTFSQALHIFLECPNFIYLTAAPCIIVIRYIIPIITAFIDSTSN